MEQVFRPGFQPLSEQQQQAKTGSVRIATEEELGDLGAGSAINLSALVEVAKADPLRATVGTAAVLGLRAVAEEKVVIIRISNDLDKRRVIIAPGSEGDGPFTAANAAAGTDVAAILTFDNSSLNNDSVSNSVADGTGLSTGINAKLATRKPSFSLASLINAVEDVVLDDGTKDALFFVDQANGTMKVLTGTDAALDTAQGAATSSIAEVQGEFIQDATPEATTGDLLGE
jgi:hypothetical protein